MAAECLSKVKACQIGIRNKQKLLWFRPYTRTGAIAELSVRLLTTGRFGGRFDVILAPTDADSGSQ